MSLPPLQRFRSYSSMRGRWRLPPNRDEPPGVQLESLRFGARSNAQTRQSFLSPDAAFDSIEEAPNHTRDNNQQAFSDPHLVEKPARTERPFRRCLTTSPAEAAVRFHLQLPIAWLGKQNFQRLSGFLSDAHRSTHGHRHVRNLDTRYIEPSRTERKSFFCGVVRNGYRSSSGRAARRRRVACASPPTVSSIAHGGGRPPSSASSTRSDARSSTSYQPGTFVTRRALAGALQRHLVDAGGAPRDAGEDSPGAGCDRPISV